MPIQDFLIQGYFDQLIILLSLDLLLISVFLY